MKTETSRVRAEHGEDYYLGSRNNSQYFWNTTLDEPDIIRRPSGNIPDFDFVRPNEDEHDWEWECAEEYMFGVEENEGAWETLTPLGRFFRAAAPFRGYRLLTSKQAKVFALRMFLNRGRTETADELGIGKNTVDNHYQTAKKKIKQASEISAATEGV